MILILSLLDNGVMNCLRCGCVLRLQPQLSGTQNVLTSQLHVEHTVEVASLTHRRHRKLDASDSGLPVTCRLAKPIQRYRLISQAQVVPAN